MTGTHVAMVMKAQGATPEPEERPVPAPGVGEVLVKVRASSVNYHDMVNLAGLIWGEWPRVPMTDGAGVVVAVGPGVRIAERASVPPCAPGSGPPCTACIRPRMSPYAHPRPSMV